MPCVGGRSRRGCAAVWPGRHRRRYRWSSRRRRYSAVAESGVPRWKTVPDEPPAERASRAMGRLFVVRMVLVAALALLVYWPLPGPAQMSYWNPTVNLVAVVAVITGLGFASVYIARRDAAPTGSLYALFFSRLPRRARDRQADGAGGRSVPLLPMATCSRRSAWTRSILARPGRRLRCISRSSRLRMRPLRRCSRRATITAGLKAWQGPLGLRPASASSSSPRCP